MNTPPAITAAAASTSENNTGAIHVARVKSKPPAFIWSELSIIALVAACDRRLVGKHDVAILVNLLGLAGRKHDGPWQCWPSVGTVAGEIGVNPSTVNRALKRLERFGYMVRMNRYLDNQQTSNVYRWRLPEYSELPREHPYAVQSVIERAPVHEGEMHTSTPGGGTHASPRGGTRAPQKTLRELPQMKSTREDRVLDVGLESDGVIENRRSASLQALAKYKSCTECGKARPPSGGSHSWDEGICSECWRRNTKPRDEEKSLLALVEGEFEEEVASGTA